MPFEDRSSWPRVNLLPPEIRESILPPTPQPETVVTETEPESTGLGAAPEVDLDIPPSEKHVPARRRWAFRVLVVASIVGAAIAASLVLYGDEVEAPAPLGLAPQIDEISVLLVVQGDDGGADSIALIAGDAEANRAMYVMPPALSMQLPGFGDGLLRSTTLIEGPELLELALMNELGIRIDRTVVIDRTTYVSAVGPFRIDIPEPFVVSGDGGDVVAVGAGSDVFVPDTAATLLLSQGESTPLEWLQRQRAVWAGFVQAVAEAPEALDAAVPLLADITPTFEGLAVNVLPVDRVGAGDIDIYVVDREGTFFEEKLQFLELASDRPRVEVLNGTDGVGVSRPVAGRLIRDGYKLIKTGNAADTYVTSLVIAQGARNQAAAIDVVRRLGFGEMVVEQPGSGVVDVSIIVGRDIEQQR